MSTHPDWPGWTIERVMGAVLAGGRTRELYELRDPSGVYHFVSVREDGTLRDTVKHSPYTEPCDVIRAVLGINDQDAA